MVISKSGKNSKQGRLFLLFNVGTSQRCSFSDSIHFYWIAWYSVFFGYRIRPPYLFPLFPLKSTQANETPTDSLIKTSIVDLYGWYHFHRHQCWTTLRGIGHFHALICRPRRLYIFQVSSWKYTAEHRIWTAFLLHQRQTL